MVNECACGQLKARWGFLRSTIDLDFARVPSIIYSCFVLHNFCEIRKQGVSTESLQIGTDYEREFQPSLEDFDSARKDGSAMRINEPTQANAKAVREIFRLYFE